MPRKLKNVLVTGGAGFIGSNFINYLFGISASGSSDYCDSGFTGRVINADCLTYAGNPDNLTQVEEKFGSGVRESERRYFFEKTDICDRNAMDRLFRKYEIDTVIHFAAESHVDRSISGPEAFIKTNVYGTFNLLEAARSCWTISPENMRDDVLFHHVSTDEVYGSLGKTGKFTENTPCNPRSPYSASKAASDHLVMSYFNTYGLPVTLSNCSNNYGPCQYPEKLIPLMILNMHDGKKLPVYGEGKNIRDWIYVEDHNRALWQIVCKGKTGEKYNIGGDNEWQNIELLHRLIEITAPKLNKSALEIEKSIVHVKDRPGHDGRYATDCTKIKRELEWEQKMPFDRGLELTVDWYLQQAGRNRT